MRDASLTASRHPAFPDNHGLKRRGGHAKDRPSVLARVFAVKRIGVLFTVAIFALAGIGVPMNALFFQDGRHPAPLFSRALAPAPAKSEIAATPTAATGPSPTDSARVDIGAVTIDPPRAASKPEPAKVEAAKTGSVKAETKKPAAAKKRDLIGQLLGAAAPRAEGPDSGVLHAQQTLLKLGYVVRADGAFGAATRQAIEKFERDNGLPATGQVTPKLLKKLAAQSGVARQ